MKKYGKRQSGTARRRGLRHAFALALVASAAIAGPAAASAELPDGRGWEIVTPVDQGDDVFSHFWAAPDGNATSFMSLSSMAGGLNGGGESYIARRGPSAWISEAMTPPGSGIGTATDPSFVGLDVTRDGTRFIWGGAYDNFDQSRDIFLGTGVKTAVNMSADVRPSAKSALYQGKTPNADHVVFALYPPFGQPDPPELFEYTDGSPRPVGILPGETTPNPSGAVLGSFERNYGTGSAYNAISEDGSRLFFESPAPVPVGSGRIPNPSGLYVRENGNTTKEIHPNAIYWNATADGATVLYTPADGSGDLGLSTYDVDDEEPTQIVPTSARVKGISGTSDDLSRVYFVALGDLAEGATAGQPNLYLHDRNSDTPLRFVATLNPTSGGNFSEAARFSSRDLYESGAITSMASADGRLLEFVSTQSLTGEDHQGTRAVYLFDAEATTDPIVCISCSPDGAPPAGDSFLSQHRGFYTLPQLDTGNQLLTEPTNITDDNRRVFFETPNALVPQDQNGKTDVYEWTDGKAHLISSGTGEESRFLVASASGDDVFFMTKNMLTWQAKSSNLRVIYDARVGGGYPEPVLRPRCENDQSCQGPSTAPPPPPGIGSLHLGGDGNMPMASDPARASVGVKRLKSTFGSVVRLRVRVPDAGRVSVRGRLVKRTNISASKAGAYSVRVALRPNARKALRRKKKLKVGVRVSYRARGGQSASRALSVTFKQPKRAKAKKGGR